MQGIFERSYGRAFKVALKAVNPIKKKVLKTECLVHKFINHQSVIILRNDGYIEAGVFFNKYMDDLNSGVMWADQDLKSGNHFYNPEKKRGLYGFSNALKECMAYYSASLTWWMRGDKNKALFYLGASCHLIQDVTVPQHVNIRLLKQHRRYEQWVVHMYDFHEGFKCYDGGIYLDNVRKFIEQNARVALDAYNKNKYEMDMDKRFYNITDIVLCRAQQSTAGFLEMFYNDIAGLGKEVI